MTLSKSHPITTNMTLEEVATVVCQKLLNAEIDVFLSGGAVVSIYSANEYQSFDLDFITLENRKKIKSIMESLGFTQEKSKYFTHPNTEYYVEFPGSAIKIGESIISKMAERKNKFGTLKILTPTQCVMDRLAAFIHFKDRQGLDQAVMVTKKNTIDLKTIQHWIKNEGPDASKCFQEFLKRI